MAAAKRKWIRWTLRLAFTTVLAVVVAASLFFHAGRRFFWEVKRDPRSIQPAYQAVSPRYVPLPVLEPCDGTVTNVVETFVREKKKTASEDEDEIDDIRAVRRLKKRKRVDKMEFTALAQGSVTMAIQIGQPIEVKLDGIEKKCSGTVSEISPESQELDTLYRVKTFGGCPLGNYVGMTGQMLIPIREVPALVAPSAAVRAGDGENRSVDMADHGKLIRQDVRVGRVVGDDLEILSGLKESDLLLSPAIEDEPPPETP